MKSKQLKFKLATALIPEPMMLGRRISRKHDKSGIYQIVCKPTGRLYVGSAVRVSKRKGEHRLELIRGDHYNRYLQRAWNKYGKENFEYCILEYCEKDKLIEIEQYYMDTFNAANRFFGFNLRSKAGSNLGLKHSLKTKAKISKARKKAGCTLSVKQIKEFSNRMIGNSLSLGMKHTDETKIKMKKARKGRMPSIGMVHTDKYKRMVSNRFKGTTLSKEHKEKISKAHKGKKKTEEHKYNLAIVQAKITQAHCEEIRKKYIYKIATARELAVAYGCSFHTIYNIINRATRAYK